MNDLDNIPQKQSIEIESVKIEDSVKEKLEQLNQKQNIFINDFGQIYLRKKEIQAELVKLDEVLAKSEVEFQLITEEIKQTIDDLDEKYPQMRINLKDGVIQYQPGAPTRKQVEQQQFEAQNQPAGSGMKVVKQ
jgi:hypothetical protein